MTKDELNKIDKALKTAAARIASNSAGYNLIMEAKMIIEKELNKVPMSNINLDDLFATKHNSIWDNIFSKKKCDKCHK